MHPVPKFEYVTTVTKVTKDDNFTKEQIFPSIFVKSKFKCDKCTRCRATLGVGAFSVAPVSTSNQPWGHGLRQQLLRP